MSINAEGSIQEVLSLFLIFQNHESLTKIANKLLQGCVNSPDVEAESRNLAQICISHVEMD